jgi:hypothetical protein
MSPDLLLRVKLKTTAEGGRSGDVVGPDYRCPLIVGGRGFDCRFLPFDRLILGVEKNIQVKLLNKDLAISHMVIGQRIELWEGRVIGVAIVLKIF